MHPTWTLVTAAPYVLTDREHHTVGGPRFSPGPQLTRAWFSAKGV